MNDQEKVERAKHIVDSLLKNLHPNDGQLQWSVTMAIRYLKSLKETLDEN